MVQKEIADAIAGVLGRYRHDLAAGYLFGSSNRGEDYGILSDVDVAVLASDNCADVEGLKLRLYADLCRTLQRNDIDIVVLNSASNLILKDEIVRNGLLLHEVNAEAREEFEVRVIHSCIDFRRQRRETMGI